MTRKLFETFEFYFWLISPFVAIGIIFLSPNGVTYIKTASLFFGMLAWLSGKYFGKVRNK